MDHIIQGDALTVLKTLPDQSVQTCVTSPPYFGLRDYGVDGQIGLEPTPEAFVAALVDVFREVRRVLRDDGTLWLNLGDSYAGSNGVGRNDAGRNFTGGGGNRLGSGNPGKQGTHSRETNLKSKDLIGIPWRVAFALQADGWYLRQDIIWHKPNPMPESVTDRCTKAHEYIFLLSKSERYYFDNEAIKEPANEKYLSKYNYDFGGNKNAALLATGQVHTRPIGKRTPKEYGGGGTGFIGHSGNRKADGTVYLTRNRRSVWTVTTKPYKGAHFATFPPDLIKPCILAGAPVGYTVLDPFFGSGTTGAVAKQHGRRYLGIELNPEYIKLAQERINSVLPPQPTLLEPAT